ncbi:hypothetical protein K431DRAFT_281299 [Polychaeton citri CBS 116435]|uniref:Uncharacterized protein n=1 Tax=Polychaeton citri CBS 116435 TaxID=1314669 RepID=A0A9P4QIH0_9PEZI|nr:hypothetical protein K431DRAFT_281299 [Polychaeton citri CBS 116435]
MVHCISVSTDQELDSEIRARSSLAQQPGSGPCQKALADLSVSRKRSWLALVLLSPYDLACLRSSLFDLNEPSHLPPALGLADLMELKLSVM